MKWEEMTDRPPSFTVQRANGPVVVTFPANRWYDAYELLPESQIFFNWERRVRREGPQTITMTDPPAIAVADGAERTLHFRITVESAPGCNCRFGSHTAYAAQKLKASSEISLENLGADTVGDLFLNMSFKLGRGEGLPVTEFPTPQLRLPPLTPPPGFGRRQ